MPLPALRVEADEPGRRLVLAGDPSPLPKRAIAIAGAALVAIAALPLLVKLVALLQSGASQDLLFALVPSALVPLTLLVLLMSAANRVTIVTRLAFEAATARLEISEFRLIGGRGSEPRLIPFADLGGMWMNALRPIPTSGTAPGKLLEITLRPRGRGGALLMRHGVHFSVAGLDKKEEAADLALRLARIVGFEYQKIVRSDPRELEIELSVLGQPGFSPLPETSQPAVALAARETTAPFDAAGFKSEFRVTVWQPGQDVRFHRPLRLSGLGCLPAALLVFTGPVAFWAAGLSSSNTLSDRVLIAFITGIFGLIFGAMAAATVYGALPRTIVFDWSERRLRIQGLFRQRVHDFAEIRGIGMMSQRIQGTKRRTSNLYYCEVTAKLAAPGDETRPVILLSTEAARDDPQASLRQCLPLVTELAKALGVPRDLGNYAA